jgi:hypothetical protein
LQLTSYSIKTAAVFKVLAAIFYPLFLITSYHMQQPADGMILQNVLAATSYATAYVMV